MEQKFLGLIAGNGKFPIVFAQKAKALGYRVVAAGVKGDTSFFLRFLVDKIQYFDVGDLQGLFEFLKNENVKQVIMAGQVSPRNLFDSNIRLDGEFKKIFDAIKDRKADTIFNAIADQLSHYDMQLMDSTFLLKDFLAPAGVLTKRSPTSSEKADAEFGKIIARMMGGIDVGQTVVVKDKAIVAIEAMEGTDQTILRGGRIAKSGAVVVKMAKPNQDLRFDVPVIGPRTIKSMIRSRCVCLVVEAGKTLIIDQPAVVRIADRAGICVFSVS